MTEIEHFGRYEVRGELGRGGMASVYLGFDPVIKRQVAIKVLPRQFTFDPQFRTRFNQEAQLIAALEHYAIVPIYDFGEHGDQPFIVMRYMPGGSLDDLLKDGPLPFDQALKIIGRLSAALDRAHEQGVIHRDLKPANILFDADGEAYLSDFGIAKIAEATATLTGSAIIGTPAYMSPEQAQALKEIDGRTDVYSLGLILFETLTGQRPYEADTPVQLALKQITEPLPNILELRPDIPSDTQLVINRALAKERADRYPTPGELSRALETIRSIAAPAVAEEAEPDVPEPATGPTVAERLQDLTEATQEQIGPRSPAEAPEEAATLPATVAPEGELASEVAGSGQADWIATLRQTGDLGASGEAASQPVRRRRLPTWALALGGLGVVITAVVLISQSGILESLGGDGESAPVQPTDTQEESAVVVVDQTATPALLPTVENTPTSIPTPQASATPAATSVAEWGELEALEGHSRPVTRLAWSTDGSRLASTSDRMVVLWDADAAGPLVEHQLQADARRVEWSQDLEAFAVTIGLGEVTVWSGRTGEQLFRLSTAYNDLGWSSDGLMLAVSTGSQIVIYDGQTGAELRRMPPTATRMIWAPEGRTLIAALTYSASHWDAETGRSLATGQGACAGFIAWSPDRTHFACGGAKTVFSEGNPSGSVRRDETVRLWSLEPLEEAVTLTGHTAPVSGVAWSADSQFVASYSEDLTVRVWNAATSQQLRLFEGEAGPPAWSVDGRLLASVDTEGTLRIWEVESGEELLSVVGAAGPVAWAPDGSRLAWAAQDGSIRIWGGG